MLSPCWQDSHLRLAFFSYLCLALAVPRMYRLRLGFSLTCVSLSGVGWGGCFCLWAVQYSEDSNIYLCLVYLGSREYWLLDHTRGASKNAPAIPTVKYHSSGGWVGGGWQHTLDLHTSSQYRLGGLGGYSFGLHTPPEYRLDGLGGWVISNEK